MRGVEPPVRTTWPPSRACSTSRSATRRPASWASATTVISTSAGSAIRELACPVHRGLNRVQERGADAGLLELADRGDRRAARRGDRLAQLDRVHALIAEL